MRLLNLMHAQDLFDNLPFDASGYRVLSVPPVSPPNIDRPLQVIVHPGSLMGPYAMYWNDNAPAGDDRVPDPETLRANVAERMGTDPRNSAVILGDFCDELVAPEDQGIQDAVQDVYRYGTVLMATPDPDALANAALQTVHLCGAPMRPSVQIAGAWGDADDGCAAVVAETLEKAGANAKLTEDTACVDPDDAWTPTPIGTLSQAAP